MTDNEHINQTGMAHGADAANDAAGQGSDVPMDYHEAEERLDAIYADIEAEHLCLHDDALTMKELKAAMTATQRAEHATCLAIIRHFRNNPNG